MLASSAHWGGFAPNLAPFGGLCLLRHAGTTWGSGIFVPSGVTLTGKIALGNSYTGKISDFPENYTPLTTELPLSVHLCDAAHGHV